MSRIINQNTEPLFIFDMPDEHLLSETISVKGEKGERGDPTKLSQLDNDTGFITKDASNLTNYYDKATTDNKLGQKLAETTFNSYEIPSDFFTGDKTIAGTGSSITLSNTANTVFASMFAYGNTSQTGTPTPSSPVGVQVATGLQTIAIYGDDPQEYAINLGDLELCQIGEHKDYIYKDGDIWYKHKAVNKAVLDGSADEGWITSGVTYRPNAVSFADLSDATTTQALSNMATAWRNTSGGITTRLPDLSFGWETTGDKLMAVRYDASESLESFKALLASTPMVIYYELASASNEEITDATLISQLNAFAAAKSCNGATSIIASGVLPVVLSVEAFKNNWDGAVSGLNAGMDAVYNKTETKSLISAAVEPYRYPHAELSMDRIYRELRAKNYDGLSTYVPENSGAAGMQGGVSTGQNTMILAYWNGDDASLNENKIIEKNISTGTVLKEVDANYGWCNGLAFNQDAGLVYVIPRGRIENGSNVNLRQIIVLRYSDLSLVETVNLNTDKTIQSACYEDGELWVMAEGGTKFYKVNTDDYSIADTVTTQIPSSNSDFYYQNFAYYDNKFFILGSAPRALMIYNKDGSLLKQYSMPASANGLYNVGEYQFISHISDKKFYIGSSQEVSIAEINQIFMIDLDKGFVKDSRNSTLSAIGGRLDIYVDSSNTNLNPDGSSSNPFKEIYEAVLIPDRTRPVRVRVANGTYGHVNLRGVRGYSMVGLDGNPDFTIKGLVIQDSENITIYNAKIQDSIISSLSAALTLRNSSTMLRSCAVSSTDKYGAYLSEFATLNVGYETTMTTPTTMNVYVDSTSCLLSTPLQGISFRKASRGSKVNFPMPLFATDQTCYLGDFSLDAKFADWYSKSLFKFISIEYVFKQVRKIVKFPASSNQVCITDNYTDGSGNTYLGKIYVGINSATTISLSGNAYVKIANNSGVAEISRTVLSDNSSGSDSFIAVKNIYLSDN